MLSNQDYDLLLVHLVRVPGLLEQAKLATLEPDDFKGQYRHFKFVLEAAYKYFDKHRQAIPRLVLEREIMLAVGQDEFVPDEAIDKLKALVELTYVIPEEQLAPEYVSTDMLQQALNETKVFPRLRTMSADLDPDRLDDIFLQNSRLYDQTRVVANKPANLFSEDGREHYTSARAPMPTNIEFVDILIGGLRPASVVGLLAESSGGKTMIGTQFACEQALQDVTTCAFFYEQSLEGDIAERFYSYLTGASRDELAGKRHSEYPYEVRSKLDRIDEALSSILRVYDMSGSVDNQGRGGPDEIEAIIGRLKREGTPPGFILIDWLGPLVTKYINTPPELGKIDHREKINYVLTRFKEIAERHSVTILILHQIAPAQIENKKPLHKPDWTTAADSKSFGWLMDYVFTLGRRCDKTDCMWFNVPKARGAPKLSRIVKMDAQHNRITDAKDFEENTMADREGVYFRKRTKRKFDRS